MAARDGVDPPEPILNKPVLLQGLELFYDAFIDLSTCRIMGGPIPFTAYLTYCDHYQIEGTQRERLIGRVQRLDRFYLEEVEKQQRKKK